MKSSIVLTATLVLFATSLYAQDTQNSCFQITTEKNERLLICDENDSEKINYLNCQPNFNACYTGDSSDLAIKINSNMFMTTDAALGGALSVGENQLAFNFGDVGGFCSHVIEKCL